jgi:Response regulators consisting of a CheY-like receiver domain and a winged-helix DNA-binding domain
MSEATPLVVSVEDNPADVRLIEEGVAAVGGDIELRVFNNGLRAVEELTGDGDLPVESIKLLLLDLNIPGKSGLEILRLLREDPQYDTVPIVTVSSSENPEDIRRVYDASANAYLTKPDDPDEFIQAIAAAVRFWMLSLTNTPTHD